MTAVQDTIRARREHPAKYHPTPNKGDPAAIETAEGEVIDAANLTVPVAVPVAPTNGALSVANTVSDTPVAPVTIPAGSMFATVVDNKVPTGQAIEDLNAQIRLQHEQEIQALKKDLADRDAMVQELQVLRAKQQQLELEKLLDFSGVDFEAMDPAVAQEFKSKVGVPLLQQVSKVIESRDTEFKRVIEQQVIAQRKQEEALRDSDARRLFGAVNAAILSAHPDGQNIIKSKEFEDYTLRTPVETGSNIMLADILRAEYNAGNAGYIINKISEFKRGRPSLGSIASVGSIGVANTPESAISDKGISDEDRAAKLNKLAVQYARKDITRAELIEERKKLMRG